MNPTELPANLFKAHLLFQKMSRYPDYYREMREVFLWVIEERRLATVQDLEAAAKERLSADGLDPEDQRAAEEYRDAIIDLCFAAAVEPAEVDSFINLARKLAKARQLSRVLHWENASSREIFNLLEEFCLLPLGDRVIPEAEASGVRVALINHFLSNQLPYVGIAKNYVTIRDVYDILQRSVWNPDRSGRIGGKSAGLILAHRILLPLFFEARPEFAQNIRVPDSYFIRSEIFDSFLQDNRLERYHSQKYHSREQLERDLPSIKAQFDKARFSEEALKGFRNILESVGEHPIILRSSSFLEDNFGVAFSGKYESVFLANQGDMKTRLKAFVAGLKRIHTSIYHPDPILYRSDHNLLDFNEHMSALVQKVVGRRFGDYFFPFAAGVAFSYNSFSWNPRINRQAGLVRIVLGLGTRAVDRVGGDYPRMVPLSHPTLRPEATALTIRKYSQKNVDVLNLKTNRVESLPIAQLFSEVTHPDLYLAASLVEGDHLAPPPTKLSPIDPAAACITFERFLKDTNFPRIMKLMVQSVSQAYGWPVDMEFAYDDGKIYLLQCRTLSTLKELERVELPTQVSADRVVFTAKTGLPNRIIEDLEYVVYVDPFAYGELATVEGKLQVARIVNRLNQVLADKRFALFGPGRWGSNDINLGVQVRYHDISRTRVLGEVAYASNGVTPEVSYGTHFFNDLIEADIVPLPLYPDEQDVIFNRDFFQNSPSVTTQLVPDLVRLAHVVRVIHVPAVRQGHFLQIYLNGAKAEGLGFLGPAQMRRTEPRPSPESFPVDGGSVPGRGSVTLVGRP
jgi:hypothetical protein